MEMLVEESVKSDPEVALPVTEMAAVIGPVAPEFKEALRVIEFPSLALWFTTVQPKRIAAGAESEMVRVCVGVLPRDALTGVPRVRMTVSFDSEVLSCPMKKL
jgi:hypothetical protein